MYATYIQKICMEYTYRTINICIFQQIEHNILFNNSQYLIPECLISFFGCENNIFVCVTCS